MLPCHFVCFSTHRDVDWTRLEQGRNVNSPTSSGSTVTVKLSDATGAISYIINSNVQTLSEVGIPYSAGHDSSPMSSVNIRRTVPITETTVNNE